MLKSTPLLLKGGRIVDPAANRDETADVLVVDRRIAAVGTDLVLPEATEVRDVSGMVVTPGLIDLHTHVIKGLGDFCLHPDQVGVKTGVTTVVDGGTSGVATFGLARRWIDDPDVKTRVLAFLDPNQIYFATKDFICHKLEIANDLRNLDVGLAFAAMEANEDVIVGCKVRACYTDDPRRSPFLDAAKEVAGDQPVMVHLGRFPFTPTISTSDLLEQLRGGDVVTHAFRAASGVLGKDGKVTAVFRDAVERGVRLDVGHSSTDFRFGTARRLFEQGFLPTTISTDINVFNIDHPVLSLPETMSKIWALGVSLPDVVAMATSHPALVVQRQDQMGSLAQGREADITVLRVEQGDISLSDGFEVIDTGRRLVPMGCVRSGDWIAAA